MKKGLLILALIWGVSTQAQILIDLQGEPNKELIDSLDNAYHPAMGPDSISPVMGDRPAEFQAEWVDWLTEFSGFLNEKGYRWGVPTRAFVRLYSSPVGNVEYMLYKFYPGTMDESNMMRFPELLEEFVKGNPLPLGEPAILPFSQCGPVTFVDAN